MTWLEYKNNDLNSRTVDVECMVAPAWNPLGLVGYPSKRTRVHYFLETELTTIR